MNLIIEHDREFPRVVQLMGIASPGLTSSPAIAEQVARLVADILAYPLVDTDRHDLVPKVLAFVGHRIRTGPQPSSDGLLASAIGCPWFPSPPGCAQLRGQSPRILNSPARSFRASHHSPGIIQMTRSPMNAGLSERARWSDVAVVHSLHTRDRLNSVRPFAHMPLSIRRRFSQCLKKTCWRIGRF